MPMPARQPRTGTILAAALAADGDGDPVAVRARITYLLGVTDEAS